MSAASKDDFSPIVTIDDIRAAYRIFLNREADAGGLAHYRTRADSADYRLRDLADEFSRSDEALAERAAQIKGIDVGGVVVAVDVTDGEFGRAIARDGVWEAHIIHTIRRCLKPGGVFVDVGANVGVMSFHAAQVVGPSGKVIAFEPNPENVQFFLRGVLLNGFDQVTLFPVGASDRSAVFSVRGGSNSYLGEAQIGGELAQSAVADRLLETEARIDFIKLDIEGHEPHALVGLRKTIARHRPTLLCEFNPRCLRDTINLDPSRFAEQLFGLATAVQVVEHDGALTSLATPIELMMLWNARNAEHIERGDLADGMVHFDLLIETR